MNKKEYQEWSIAKRWNPFNSYKLLAHVYRWEKIRRGAAIPQPVLVSIDPVNRCNLHCAWCNSGKILEERQRQLSATTLDRIADFLPKWRGSDQWPGGVEAVCVGGGGEPLLNRNTGAFIERATALGVEAGIVTNGLNIGDHLPALLRCTWVGVSVDAGTGATYNKLKAGGGKADLFGKVCDNIAALAAASRRTETRLGVNRSGYGVSYKYLLYRENFGEIYRAAKLAKELGCRNFHLRPATTPWDKLATPLVHFSDDDIAQFEEEIERARQLEDENFGVYGITHKFDEQLALANHFSQCFAVFMTGVFMPADESAPDPDAFTFGLCCDRRADGRLELVSNETDVAEVARRWGAPQHWAIFDGIEVEKQCPRCTYLPHNQIFQYVIRDDSMTVRFI